MTGHYALAVTSASTGHVVSRPDLQTFLRLSTDSAGQDELLLDVLEFAAQRLIEERTGRSLLQQTYTLTLDRDAVPTHTTEALVLPKAPLVSVSSVVSYNESQTAATWSTSEYAVDTGSEPGRLLALDAYSWPSDLRSQRSLVVTFAAGYSTASSGVPEPLALAVQVLCGHLYEHRGDEYPTHSPDWDLPFGLPSLVSELIAPYALPTVG